MVSQNDIAVVIESMEGGGAQRVVSALLAHWIGQGVRVALITFKPLAGDIMPVPATVERRIIGEFPRATMPLGGMYSNLRRIVGLRSALRASGAGTVLSFVGTTNILTMLASLGLGMRVVISERNDPALQSLGRLWDVLRRLTYPLANLVTANTAAATRTMAAYVAESKLAVLPNPIQFLAPGCEAPHDEPVILAVGRLHVQKNHGFLLRGFAASGLAGQGWRLRILGEGKERSALQALAAALGIADAVEWRGFVSDPFPHYRTVGIFALVSHYEGSPNALIEAMGCGAACIVSDALAGALELVTAGRSAIVFRAGDLAGFSGGLQKLAADGPLRAKLGATARQAFLDGPHRRALSLWDAAVLPKRETV